MDGRYEGEPVQPAVFFYGSHLHFNITARATRGSEVEVILCQQSPVSGACLVKT